ncbi:hypothetical protein KEM52_005129, partial [Ascosphaera acerosa]
MAEALSEEGVEGICGRHISTLARFLGLEYQLEEEELREHLTAITRTSLEWEDFVCNRAAWFTKARLSELVKEKSNELELSRFGRPAYREWDPLVPEMPALFTKERLLSLLAELMPSRPEGAVDDDCFLYGVTEWTKETKVQSPF